MSDARGGSASQVGPAAVPVDAAGDVPPIGPALLVESLARTLAVLHAANDDLAEPPGSAAPQRDSDGRLRSITPCDVVEAAECVVRGGWSPDRGSPWSWISPDRLVEVLRSGASDVASRAVETVPTIGAARIGNLDMSGVVGSAGADAVADQGTAAVLRRGADRRTDRFGRDVPAAQPPGIDNHRRDLSAQVLSGSSNVVFRTSRRSATGSSPRFVDLRHMAMADPYRDLAVAAADVVASVGAGAVIGFIEAYASLRPSVEPIDPVRLDWWSLAATLPEPGPW